MEIWDRFDLAGLLNESGDSPGGRRELEEADKLLRSLEQGRRADNAVLANLRAESHLRGAEALLAAGNPQAAIRELDFHGTDGQELAAKMRVFQVEGLALAATSDLPRAARAFEQAIALNQQTASAVPSWVNRIPVLEAAAPSYRGLTEIQIQHDRDAAGALRTWKKLRSEADAAGGLNITMAVLPKGIAVWRSGGGQTTVRWVDSPVENVLRTSKMFRQLVMSPASDEREVRSVGAQLFRWLLGPDLRSAKPGLVHVNADSWLAAVPLGALTDYDGNYALRNWSFVETYGPAPARHAEAEQRGIGPNERALIVAAPSAITPGHVRLPFLTAAIPEATAVSGHFRDSILVKSPSLEQLWEALPRSTVFHFVGHGWVNGGGGGIVLGATSDNDSMFLTSRDLVSHDWSHCRLAVLSACLTAAGAERGPVDNQSLVQALLGAGVGRVLAARWSVDSEATRVLMEGFYSRLLTGAPAAEALAHSASDVSARAGWKHPFYWAGFGVFGNT
jgi:CHAT domain-containing protein